MLRRLSEIPVGETVLIKSFENNDIFLKLMEMGCVPGETIRVEQVAPLGDPIAISVSGYSLSLRLNEAQNIFVENTSNNEDLEDYYGNTAFFNLYENTDNKEMFLDLYNTKNNPDFRIKISKITASNSK